MYADTRSVSERSGRSDHDNYNSDNGTVQRFTVMDVPDKWGAEMKDIIYREDAVGVINGWFKLNHLPEFGDEMLHLVPSADRPQGEWIEHERAEEVNGMLISNYECSYCHEWERKASDYCPNCGARMLKGAEAEG